MAADEMFESGARSTGDLAGVFEYDGEVGYFYLYELEGTEGQKVTASLQILSTEPDFAASDLVVRWDAGEDVVGLFIRGRLWAAFQAGSRAKYGGDYRADAEPRVPIEIGAAFE